MPDCDGAIAQLGERLHGMQEVGGSIPPGSTSLRSLRELRLGKPGTLSRGEVSEGCRAEAPKARLGALSAKADRSRLRAQASTFSPNAALSLSRSDTISFFSAES